MSLPFWADAGGQDGADYADTPWDILYVGTTPVPGIVELQGVNPERKVDDKSPAGKNGGTPTFHGRKPCMFGLRVRIWTPQQWQEFQALQKRIWPNGGAGKVEAFDLSHPGLQSAGISAGSVVSVSDPQPTGVPGERAVMIKWLEFRKPGKKPATRTLTAAKADVRKEFTAPASFSAADGTPVSQIESNATPPAPSSDKLYSGPG